MTGRRPRASVAITLLVFAGLATAVSREVLELAFGTIVAYLIQYAVLAASLLGLLVLSREIRGGRVVNRTRPAMDWLWIVTLSFVGLALVSLVLTSQGGAPPAAWVYVGLMVFFAVLLTTTATIRFGAIRSASLGGVLAVILVVLFGVATLQQLEWFTAFAAPKQFDGSVRPTSLTGSAQHYSLVVALLTIYFLEIHASLGKPRYLALAGLGVVATFASLTRGGMLVLAVAALARGAFLLLRLSRGSIRWKPTYGRVAFVLAVVAVAILVAQPTVAKRIASIVDPDNHPLRLERWGEGIDIWLGGPLWVGDSVGLATQAGRVLDPAYDPVITESGVIQQLVNFGLLGTVTFFVLVLAAGFAGGPRREWLRAGIVGAFVESFTYMSIETLPYLALVIHMPILHDWLEAREEGGRA